MLPLLVVMFVVLPILELWVLFQVGELLGFLPALALLLGVSVAGGWLVRREGARAWRAFRRAMGEGRVPGREVADGAMVLFGGALLLTPGFVTDAFGLLLLLPPTRAVIRAAALRWAGRRVRVATWVTGGGHDGLRDRRRTQRVEATRADAPPDVPPPAQLPPD